MQLTEGALTWPLTPTGMPTGYDPDVWDVAVAVAVEWLFDATARAYGSRAVTWRPQSTPRACWLPDFDWLRSIYDFGYGWPYIGDPTDAVRRLAVIELPGPVSSTDPADVTVTIYDDAGAPVAAPPFRIDGSWLVRTDGQGWPSIQDAVSNMGAPNTWSVAYLRGRVPPLVGQAAAQRLALAWYGVLSGNDKTCKLPYNATTVTRAGTTINRDVLASLKTTGIELVDRWVAQVNPRGQLTPGSVFSPDLARNRAPYTGSFRPW